MPTDFSSFLQPQNADQPMPEWMELYYLLRLRNMGIDIFNLEAPGSHLAKIKSGELSLDGGISANDNRNIGHIDIRVDVIWRLVSKISKALHIVLRFLAWTAMHKIIENLLDRLGFRNYAPNKNASRDRSPNHRRTADVNAGILHLDDL